MSLSPRSARRSWLSRGAGGANGATVPFDAALRSLRRAARAASARIMFARALSARHSSEHVLRHRRPCVPPRSSRGAAGLPHTLHGGAPAAASARVAPTVGAAGADALVDGAADADGTGATIDGWRHDLKRIVLTYSVATSRYVINRSPDVCLASRARTSTSTGVPRLGWNLSHLEPTSGMGFGLCIVPPATTICASHVLSRFDKLNPIQCYSALVL